MMRPTVAAFRAYAWDHDIARLAQRFFAACPGTRHVVLMDESRGTVDIGTYEKISHTDDTAKFGLPRHAEANSLWFNCDYAFYILRHALPDYQYYVLCESDVAVNLPLTPMLNAIATRGIDFVARDIRPASPDWYWYDGGAAHFREPWRALLVLSILSARTADFLYQSRVAMADVAGPVWPFSEVFVMSALQAAGTFAFADLAEFANVDDLNFRPRLSLNDPKANRPGTLTHAVLGSEAFIAAMLAEYPPRNYFNPQSELRARLCHEPRAAVLRALEAAFARPKNGAPDRAGQSAVERIMMSGTAMAEPKRDLARNKPALSSSVSAWSAHSTPEHDAQGANGTELADDFGFHTALETAPWWLVDLLDEVVIDEVRILNRWTYRERFMNFQILSSRDGAAWISRYVKTDLAPVSSDPLHPWCHIFIDPFVARFVKIALLGEGMLHLRLVQVFGRHIVPTAAESSNSSVGEQPL